MRIRKLQEIIHRNDFNKAKANQSAQRKLIVQNLSSANLNVCAMEEEKDYTGTGEL